MPTSCRRTNAAPAPATAISKAARAKTAARTWSARSWPRPRRLPAILWMSAHSTASHLLNSKRFMTAIISRGLLYILTLSPSIVVLGGALIWILRDQSLNHTRKAAAGINVAALVFFMAYLLYHPGFRVLPLALCVLVSLTSSVLDRVGEREERGLK